MAEIFLNFKKKLCYFQKIHSIACVFFSLQCSRIAASKNALQTFRGAQQKPVRIKLSHSYISNSYLIEKYVYRLKCILIVLG